MWGIRRWVVLLGLLGTLAFGAAFVAAYARPDLVERAVRDVIRQQVELRVHEKITQLDAKFLSGRAERLAKTHADEMELAKRHLAEQLPALLAATVAEMQDLNCACRKAVEVRVRERLEGTVATATQARARLVEMIRSQYLQTAGSLLREFRIFSGANAIVFVLLLVAALRKPAAGLHFLPAAAVLLLAAVLTAYLYLFNQDWLHTLVFSDFVGLAYLGYLGLAFAFLSDILFNRGQVTVGLVNGLSEAAGSAFVIVPC